MKIDHQSLANQKLSLLYIIERYEKENHTETVNDLTGILHLLDALQDEHEDGKPPIKVLIGIEGGMVSSIASNEKDMRIVIIDHDSADVGEKCVQERELDYTFENGYDHHTDESQPVEMEIHDTLKAMKF